MSKSIISALTLALALVGCGAQTSTEASITAAASSSVEAVLTKVAVTPTNGGINPDYFAYVINGDVLLGGNSCEAQGVTASLKSSAAINGVVTVKAVLMRPSNYGTRICPRLWAPVYKTLSLTVRGQHSQIRKVLIKNVNELGTLLDAADLTAQDEVVITSPSATPANGGINPDAFALVIKGTVVGGSNACQAAANGITLVQKQIGHTIYVSAVHGRRLNVMCTAEYMPVNKELSITVRGSSSAGTSIVVKNVDTLGNDVDAASLSN